MGEVLFGCSGWSYKDWVGPIYRTEKESKLRAYSRVFRTAEINSTFYAYPSKGTVLGWLRYTPSTFVYTAKVPRLITHKKKLDLKLGVEKDLERFCELMRPLRLDGKLGCLLIQLPPSTTFDPNLLEGFLRALPTEFRFAIEFRDLSWLRNETWRILERHRVAYTIVDEPLLPPEVRITTDIAYMRWHGRGGRPWYNYRYKAEELEPWIPKVEEVAEKTKKVYGYFNNHFHGYAVDNCLHVLEMLGKMTPKQTEAKKTLDKYFEIRAAAPPTEEGALPLAALAPEKVEAMDFRELLGVFMDARRVRRAQGIKDREVTLQEAANDQVMARIRDYHVVIDPRNRQILHDCADWSRCLPKKQFCKHIGKLMMLMPKERALKIMRKICLERDRWEFKPYAA